MNVLAMELEGLFEEEQPMAFYREIFPEGELDEWRDEPAERGSDHRYTGIIVEIHKSKRKNGKQHIKRYTVTDDLDEIDRVIWGNDFCVLAPISYVGKSRRSVNARILYALCIELDNLVVKNNRQSGLYNLIHQWTKKIIPTPTYTVASGSGLHLYYVFEQGIPLFPNTVASLEAYKRYVTYRIWNKFTTRDYKEENIQYESLFQAFRMVGSITKKGDRVRAFRTGERVSIEYMNSFIPSDEPRLFIDATYKSNLTLAMAKKKYPEWYERRVVKGEPKGRWTCKRDLYDWWKRQMSSANVGHRYYCMMVLVIYAIKCDISREELEADCLEFTDLLEELTEKEDNHFTLDDMMDALQSFEDKNLVTYPLASIINRSGIAIERNKRNGRKQADHIKLMNFVRDEINGNKDWRSKGGRPKGESKEKDIVLDWRFAHPEGRKVDCIRETGLAKSTVYRWWDCIYSH